MKAAEARTKALAREVQKELPQLRAKGRLLFLTPVNYLLRGVMLDASGFSKDAFYPTAFVLPLYKDNDICFTFGGRLRTPKNNWHWDIGNEEWASLIDHLTWAIKEQAIPFFERLKAPIDMALACASGDAFSPYFRWLSGDIHVREAAAYSWLLAGNVPMAVRYAKGIQQEISCGTDRRDWVMALNERAQRFEERLATGKEEVARQELHAFAQHSAEALGLSRWVVLPDLEP
jgi:hypothetical protein